MYSKEGLCILSYCQGLSLSGHHFPKTNICFLHDSVTVIVLCLWYCNTLPNLFLWRCQLNITKGQAEGVQEKKQVLHRTISRTQRTAVWSDDVNTLFPPTLMDSHQCWWHTDAKITAISGACVKSSMCSLQHPCATSACYHFRKGHAPLSLAFLSNWNSSSHNLTNFMDWSQTLAAPCVALRWVMAAPQGTKYCICCSSTDFNEAYLDFWQMQMK